MAQQYLVIANAGMFDAAAGCNGLPEARGADLAGVHRQLHDGPHHRRVEPEAGHGADDAFAADRGSLDRLAILHYGQQRQHAVMREVDVLDVVSCLVNYLALLQGGDNAMRTDQA